MTYMTAPDFIAARAIVKPPVIRSIIADVSRQTGIAPSSITGPCRSTAFVKARDLVCYVAHREGLSFPLIGRELNRDPSSVWTAARREAIRRGEV